ncbi:hypothetical protein Naga_103040g1 [Nannochloropsis gaditana]|uniref:Uncharacterized protein n=1 Tax=Nannochloropsis gaditana TaxID=72520 RepID=W7T8W6_9STRA|nr:hypothetical protein Naga_103040g1 [Nannochloropsis gaditana]
MTKIQLSASNSLKHTYMSFKLLSPLCPLRNSENRHGQGSKSRTFQALLTESKKKGVGPSMPPRDTLILFLLSYYTKMLTKQEKVIGFLCALWG